MTEKYKPIDWTEVVPPGTPQKYTPYSGEVLSAPGDSAVAKAMGEQNAPISPIDDPRMLPKIAHTAIASMPKDPMLKARYLATKIFPDMAPNQALSRMGYDGQRFYYVAHDGKAYFAEPLFEPFAGTSTTVRELPNTVASKIGPAMPAVGGIVGGILGGPEPASVGTAAAGGMLGESMRQALAKMFTDEDRSTLDRYMGLGQAAVEQGAGQAIGLGVAKVGSKLLDKNPLKVSGYDASKITPAKVSEMQSNADLAKSYGVNVTPGEAGDIASLLQNQRQLLRQPESADTISSFYSKRNIEEIPDGWVRFLNQVSPNASAAVANRDLGAAAQAAVKTARNARSELASPIYKEANAANPSLASPELDSILKTPAGQKALKDTATAMQNDRTLLGVSDAELTALKNELVAMGKMADPKSKGVANGLKLQTYDLIKRQLYDMEQAAKDARTGADTFQSRAIGNLRTALTKELDRLDATKPPPALTEADLLATGKYAQARGVFEENSPAVTDLEKGIVGIIAKDKPNALQSLPKVLFSATSSDPYSIAQAKAAFQKAGRMAEWDAATRSFLQNTFDEAVKNGGNAGPANSLWKNIAGDRRQMANLRVALGAKQFEALQDFMKIIEMVKRAPAEGSPTVTDLGSRTGFAGSLAKGAANVIRAGNPFNLPEALAAKITDVSAGKNAAALADAITNPKAIASLKKLKVLKPGTKQFVTEFGNLSAILGWGSATGAMSAPPPMQPGTIPETAR